MTHLFDPHFQTNNSSGTPNAGALLTFFQTTTTTPITVYQDSGKITPWTQPVAADASGLFPPIYVDTDTYKVVLSTSASVIIQTIDPVFAPLTASNSSQVKFADGTVSAPGISFTNDTNTGFYRLGADNLGVALGGLKKLDITTSLLQSALTLVPLVSGANNLGSTTLPWGSLFLKSTGKIDFNNGDVTITHAAAAGGSLTFAGASGGYTFAGGNVSITGGASLNVIGGTIGFSGQSIEDTEGNGTGLYLNTVVGGPGITGVVTSEQCSILATDFTGTNVNTAQPVFSSAQDVFTLGNAIQGITYQFEAEYQIDTTGTTSHALGILFANSGLSISSISYSAITSNGAARGTPAAASASRFEVATVSNVTAAVAAATQNVVRLRGILRIGSGSPGTLTPQFQYSAAPGAAPTIRSGSFFRIWSIGTDTATTVGQVA